jgi:hypothetical protein
MNAKKVIKQKAEKRHVGKKQQARRIIESVQ